MGAALQSRINPPKVQSPLTISDVKMSEITTATDSNGGLAKVDFKSVLMNSNDDVFKERAAKSGGDLSNAKSYEDFLQNLNDNTSTKRTPKNELGKDDFLKLFITQLQNQDPLKPKDGAEMASQLAQFHSLEQMMNFNKGLERLEKSQTASQSMSYLNYIGKEVSVNGGRVRLKEDGVGDVNFNVDADLVSTKLEVRDTGGTLVATKDLGNMSKGMHKLGWDGNGKDGQKLPNANYSFSISGTDVGGKEVPVSISTRVKITGVDMANGQSEFYSTLGKIKMDEIAAIGEKGFEVGNQNMLSAPKKSQGLNNLSPNENKSATNSIPGAEKMAEAQKKVDNNLKTSQKNTVSKTTERAKELGLPDHPFQPQTPAPFGYQNASEPFLGDLSQPSSADPAKAEPSKTAKDLSASTDKKSTSQKQQI